MIVRIGPGLLPVVITVFAGLAFIHLPELPGFLLLGAARGPARGTTHQVIAGIAVGRARLVLALAGFFGALDRWGEMISGGSGLGSAPCLIFGVRIRVLVPGNLFSAGECGA
jgi:hypothetical protein